MTTAHTKTLQQRSSRRSTPVLLSILFILIIVSRVLPGVRERARFQEELHGQPKEATFALTQLISETPAARRQELLLKDVNDPASGLRYAAIDALGSQRGPAVAAAIENAFSDSSAAVRQRALEGLPFVDHERGLHLLMAGLLDEDSWIRQAAAIQLLAFSRTPAADRRAVPVLIQALSDSDPAVRTTAMGSLRLLTHQPWHVRSFDPLQQQHDTIDRWRNWWAHARTVPPWCRGMPKVEPIRPARIDPAPDFRLTCVDGSTVQRDNRPGRLTLLNFWGTWCPPCQGEVPDLDKLDHAYRGRGLDVIGVALNQDDGAEGLRQWCLSHGVGYREALSTMDVQDAFGDIHELPVSVLIDGKGQIRYRWEGERDYATFRAAVERLISNR